MPSQCNTSVLIRGRQKVTVRARKQESERRDGAWFPALQIEEEPPAKKCGRLRSGRRHGNGFSPQFPQGTHVCQQVDYGPM